MNTWMENKDVFNYHFLDVADKKKSLKETGTVCVVPSTAVATSQNVTMASMTEKEMSQRNESDSQINPKPNEEMYRSVDISEHEQQLMNHLVRKDKQIENLSSELQNLESRLQAAVTEKMDALARLDRIEGKELALSYKEKQMNSDAERLNNTIESLTEDSNKNVAELIAARQEVISITADFEIDSKKKSEQLKMANLSIDELSETNEMLKAEKEELEHKLREQLVTSGKMKKVFEDELKVKTGLSQLYNENRCAYEAQIDELTDGIHELQRLLNEVIDDYGILETRLKGRELDHQEEMKPMEEMITKMKQELKDANRLLEVYNKSDSDNNDTEDKAEVGNDLPLATDHPMTLTELYSQWRSVVKQLQSKDEECKTFETELKRLIEEVQEKADEFKRQQNEMEKLRALNDQHIEQRNCFLVEKVVGREELDSSRLQCELLKSENEKLKFYGNEFLSKLFSNDQPIASGTGRKWNIDELEQQNEKLLAIINGLMETIKREDSEILDGNTAPTATTINGCHESKETPENGLLTAGNQCHSDDTNQKQQRESLLAIEEMRIDNFKLQNAKQTLIAERNWLLAKKSLFTARYGVLNSKIALQNEQIQKLEKTIEENTYTNKYLKDENESLSMKLSTVQNRLDSVESQHRTLCHIKNSLVVEVEALKPELRNEKVANKNLRHKVEKMERSLSCVEAELQMRMSDSSECRVMVHKWSAERVEDLSEGNVSKASMDESSQTDFENGNHHGRDTDETMNNSAGTTKSEPPECLSRGDSSSAKSNNRKRKPKNAGGDADSSLTSISKRRPKKVARVECVDLSEESDEDAVIDVCGVDSSYELPDIKLQYLNEMKTRKQARFISEAFNCKKVEASPNDKPDQKISDPKNKNRRSGRSQSSVNVRSPRNVKISQRSRSASSNVQKSNAGRQQSKGTRNARADIKAETSNCNRRRSSKRIRSQSDVRSNAKAEVSSRSQSAIGQQSKKQSSVAHPKSKVKRQQRNDDDCYILQPTVSASIPTDDNRRSRRLISRFRRVKRETDHQPTDGDCYIVQSTVVDHQSKAGRSKSNVGLPQPMDAGDCYLAQSSGSNSNCFRRSRRLKSRLRRVKKESDRQKSNVDLQPTDSDCYITQSTASEHPSNVDVQQSMDDCYIAEPTTSDINDPEVFPTRRRSSLRKLSRLQRRTL